MSYSCANQTASSHTSDESIGSKASNCSLQQLHAKQLLIYGQSCKEQQDAIVNALGGIDTILQTFIWTSDAKIDDDTTANLKHIITNPHLCKQSFPTKQTIARSNTIDEDHGDGPMSIKYEFNDDDMILFKLFNKRRANKIKSMISSKITIIILVFIFCVAAIPSAFYFANIISLRLMGPLTSIFFSFFALYLFLCLLCANTVALKLLTKEFVFWFKMFYFCMYLATGIWIELLNTSKTPLILIYPSIPFVTALLTLTMIIDAINISQPFKVMLTVFAVAQFANGMLTRQQQSFHRLPIYAQSDVQIPSLFEYDRITINLVDLSKDTCQVLAIFSFKQLIAAIRKPDKAAVIKINPLIIYNDREKRSIWSMRKLKSAQIALIGWLCLLFVGFCAQIFLDVKGMFLLALVLFAMLLAICCLIQGSKGAFYCACIATLFDAFIYCVGVILFEWDPILPGFHLLNFGLIVMYRIQLDHHLEPLNLTNDDEKKKVDGCDDSSNQDLPDLVVKPTMIDVQNIHDAGQWDNVDRQESINSFAGN